MLLFLLACTTPAPTYADALHAADFEAGWASCAGVGADRADCEQAVSKRFGRFDRCDQIEGVWRDECRFAEAEHLSRQKDRPGAIAACQTSKFVANCEQHVLDSLAMDLREQTTADVEAAYAVLGPGTTGKNTELDFWRSWHRLRLEAGLPMVAEACTAKMCQLAVRIEVQKRVHERIRRDGCGVSAPAFVGESPRISTWADETWRQRCCPEGVPCSGARVELAGQTE